MKIGKNGLNPTIPLCPYCGKEKNEILLTGLEGEKWAEKNGYTNMPMHICVEGDITPCDECQKKGIAVVEVVSDYERNLTGNRWLVTEDFVKRIVEEEMCDNILEKRILMLSADTAKALGFYQFFKA